MTGLDFAGLALTGVALAVGRLGWSLHWRGRPLLARGWRLHHHVFMSRGSAAGLSAGRRKRRSLAARPRGLAGPRVTEDFAAPDDHAHGEQHRRQRSEAYGQVDEQEAVGEHAPDQQSHAHEHDREDGTEPDHGQCSRAVLAGPVLAGPVLASLP